MNTITITKKEYNALVFAKGLGTGEKARGNKAFADFGFGILKKSLGKISSVSYANKLRKSWRS